MTRRVRSAGSGCCDACASTAELTAVGRHASTASVTPVELRAIDRSAQPPFDERRERHVAWALLGVVLTVLTVVKPLGGIPVLGVLGFTVAAGLQLYLPLWRADKLGLSYGAFLGLRLRTWRRDLGPVLVLVAVSFPPFIVGHHLYMTAAHDWAVALGWPKLAWLLPHRALAVSWPSGALEWLHSGRWLGETVLAHTLGVALPEETFYRGYLQPRLESLWPARRRVFGAPLGAAALVTAFAFASGHFLGEWNPLRLGPFFPALVFAWLRVRTGGLLAPVAFHALCNIYGELLFALYRPV